jgi:hypothetical protein
MINRKQIDIYVSVHKGIRLIVGRFSFLAGAADWENPAAASQLSTEWEVMKKQLHSHQDHEDRFIHPLLAKISHGSHRSYETDHLSHRNKLKHLDDQFKRIAEGNGHETDRYETGLEFYREINLFYSDFLRHLHREEVEAERILNALSLPEELEDMLKRLIGSIPHEEMLLYIDTMFPAMNLRECATLLNNFKAGASENFFDSLAEHVRSVRGDSDWEKIKEYIS